MAPGRHADLLLANARLPTVQPGVGKDWFVAVQGNIILACGALEDASQFKGPHTREVDCQGMALIPGFNDAHLHLLALASSLRGVDCHPEGAGSLTAIVEAIGHRAAGTAPGSWIRAFGYDEYYLAERRHPTRWDLDRAAPYHPVRLDHRTGHATVLNSRALELLGVARDTPDPPDGVIERDHSSGEPTGVLFEMAGLLRRATVNRGDRSGFLEGIREANKLLLSRGITSIQDAGPGNDARRWRTVKELKEGGHLAPRVTLMAGASHLQSFVEEGLTPGSGDHNLRVGAAKLMLSFTTGTMRPAREELRELVRRCHGMGFQLAIHAVEEEAVDAAAEALLEAQSTEYRPQARHRIEHCAECPPSLVGKLRAARALVVTNPCFLYHSGEKYLSLVDRRLLPHLYPAGALARAAVPLAAGSDAPVTSPNPLLSIYAAVTRTAKDDSAVAPSQAVTVEVALEMHTYGGAYASFEEGRLGSVAAGKLADLTLLDRDPTALAPEEIREVQVMMTVVDGQVMWER